MAQLPIKDILLKQVLSSAGNLDVPANLKEKVLGGLSDSVLGSLTQTATKAGGIDMIKELLTGKASAASSPITALAGKLFANNIAGKLGLNNAQTSSATAIIPTVITKLSSVIKDQDGDGDVDLNDILIALKGGGAGSSILGMAGSILGGILKK